MFKLIYQENANKDPIVRKLQGPAAKYIELLEKIQTNNQVLYGSGVAVAQLIGTLSDRDYEISKIKKLYNSNWELADGLFKEYWMMAIDLVNIVSQEVDNLTALGRVRNALEAEYSMGSTDPMLVKKNIFSDERYRTIARNVMDAQHRFKKTNHQRVKCVNELLTELNSLLALEKALISASERDNSLDAYDMTVNQQHLKRVVQNLKGHAELTDDLIDKLDEYHGRLDKLEDTIHEIESEFRRANGSDPNFYNAVAPATTYEELFYIGRNAQKSLDIEIQNLKQEVKEMEGKDIRLKQKDHLIILNHPKTLGLSAAKKTAEDLMKRDIKDTTLLVTEIADCMKREGDEVDFCVGHLRAVKDIDVKKLQSHIDYIRHQQLATGNLAKYAKLMFALHSQRRKLIEKEDLMLMDKHKLEQNKKLADLIATRATMDAKIKENISKRNIIENLYAKSLSKETNTQDKQMNKVMERIIDNNNQVSRVLYELNQQQNELNNASIGPSQLYGVSSSDTENIRTSLEKDLDSDVKIGKDAGDVSLPLGVYKDAYLDISRNGTENWNEVFADQTSVDPEVRGDVHEFSPVAQAGGARKVLKKYLRSQLDEAGHGGFKEAQEYFVSGGKSKKRRGKQSKTGSKSKAKALAKDHFGFADYPSATSQSSGNYLSQSGGVKKQEATLEELIGEFKEEPLTNGVTNGIIEQTGGAGLALVVAKHHSLEEYTRVLDELIAEKRAKLLSKVTIGPSQSVKVERFKVDLVLHKRREEILKGYLNSKGVSFVNSLEKINKRIETEYIMNALFADIGAYQRQHRLIKKISDEFDHQNSVVMKVFAVVIRLVNENSQEYRDLHTAEAEFQAKVRTMTMHSEKINVLCHPSKINLVEVIKNVDNAEEGKPVSNVNADGKMSAVGASRTCAVAIGHFDKLVRTLVGATSDFLNEMNNISNRAIGIERGQMYASMNITRPQDMNWAFNQVTQGKADVLAEIRSYISQYAKASYSTHEYVRNNLMTSSDYYFDTQLEAESLVIKTQIDNNSPLRTDLTNEYNKLDTINDGIKEIIEASGDFTKVDKTVGERVLLLDMKLKQRAHQLNVINNILLNVDNLLNRHRMLSEQSAEHKLKKLYAQQMLDGVWKSLAVLQYDIDEKLTRMNAISIAYNTEASKNDINQKFRDFTGHLNENVNSLLNLWQTVKQGLKETFGVDGDVPRVAQLGGRQYGGSRISEAHALQVAGYPNKAGIKSVLDDQRSTLQNVLQVSLSAHTQAERLQSHDGATDNEKLELAKYIANIVAPLDKYGDHKDSLHLLAEVDNDNDNAKFSDIDPVLFEKKTNALFKRQYPLDKLTLYLFEVIVKVQEVCAKNAETIADRSIVKATSPIGPYYTEVKRSYPLASGNLRRVEAPVQNLVNAIRNYRASELNPEYGPLHKTRIETLTKTATEVAERLFKDTGVQAPDFPILIITDDAVPTTAEIKALEGEIASLVSGSESNLATLNTAIKTLSNEKYCKYEDSEESYENPVVNSVDTQVGELGRRFNDAKSKVTDAKYLAGKLQVVERLISIIDAVCSLASQLQRHCEPRIISGYKKKLVIAENKARLEAQKAKQASKVVSTKSSAGKTPKEILEEQVKDTRKSITETKKALADAEEQLKELKAGRGGLLKRMASGKPETQAVTEAEIVGFKAELKDDTEELARLETELTVL